MWPPRPPNGKKLSYAPIKSLFNLSYLTNQRLQGRTWPWRQESRQRAISFFDQTGSVDEAVRQLMVAGWLTGEFYSCGQWPLLNFIFLIDRSMSTRPLINYSDREPAIEERICFENYRIWHLNFVILIIITSGLNLILTFQFKSFKIIRSFISFQFYKFEFGINWNRFFVQAFHSNCNENRTKMKWSKLKFLKKILPIHRAGRD